MSIDSVFVHKMWNDNELSKMVTGGVPFPMLSDAGGRVGKVFGVYDEEAGVETQRPLHHRSRRAWSRAMKCSRHRWAAMWRESSGRSRPFNWYGKQRQGSHAIRLEARENNAQTRPGPCGQGMGSVENRYGLRLIEAPIWLFTGRFLYKGERPTFSSYEKDDLPENRKDSKLNWNWF